MRLLPGLLFIAVLSVAVAVRAQAPAGEPQKPVAAPPPAPTPPAAATAAAAGSPETAKAAPVPAASETAPLPVAPAEKAAATGDASDTAPAEAADDSAATSGQADAPDDASNEPEIDEAARELEELRAAEEATVDEGAKRASEVFRGLHRLGVGSPLRLRLNDALEPGSGTPILPDPEEVEAAALAEVGEFEIEKAKKEYDIPVEMQPLVAEYIRFFQTTGRKHFVKWVGRSDRYLPMMRKALKEKGLPEDIVYLSMIESGFSSMAYSRAKAAGLWQFIAPTGQRYGLRIDFWVDERRDPVKATYAAAAYLKALYDEFGDWRLAWAGYNAGEGKVRKAIKVHGTTDFWEFTKGRVFRTETKHYVPKLMAAALISKHLKQFGFDESEFEHQQPLAYDEAEVADTTDLEVVARAAGASLEQVKELNPELRRWCTPPPVKGEAFKVKLPVGTGQAFAENFAKVAPRDRLSFRAHRVGKGETLSKIAAQFHTATEAIMRMNGLKDSRRLRVGTELVIPVPRSGSPDAQVKLAEQSRKRGFTAAPEAEEIPAGNKPAKAVGAGIVKRSVENGRTKVVYAITAGDSLWSVAREFNVTVAELKAWNDLNQRRIVLRIGQELVVYPDEKGGKASAEPAKTPGTKVAANDGPKKKVVHVLAPGDTLFSVGQRYGVSVDDLKKWNGLGNSEIKAGQPLTVLTQ